MGNHPPVNRLYMFQFEDDDSFFYFGTVTGDVFAINMSTNIFQVTGLLSLSVSLVTSVVSLDAVEVVL